MGIISGAVITHLRKQRGWEQKELAEAARVDASVISRLERDLQEDFKISVIAAVALALGVTIDSLLNPSFRLTEPNLIPELQVEIMELGHNTPNVQRQVAAIIHGYLATSL